MQNNPASLRNLSQSLITIAARQRRDAMYAEMRSANSAALRLRREVGVIPSTGFPSCNQVLSQNDRNMVNDLSDDEDRYSHDTIRINLKETRKHERHLPYIGRFHFWRALEGVVEEMLRIARCLEWMTTGSVHRLGWCRHNTFVFLTLKRRLNAG
ncbi:hypothetical protein BC829DRAFT_233434 [Chytridium lagenaria]|nr:hypothetical protein BC829DRAFT_233434 [Chytridium lagenaria]